MLHTHFAAAADEGLSPRIFLEISLIPDFHKVANLCGNYFMFHFRHTSIFFCWSHACNALQYLQWLNQRKTRLLNDALLRDCMVAFFVPLSDETQCRYIVTPCGRWR